jgi:hypothetical protein
MSDVEKNKVVLTTDVEKNKVVLTTGTHSGQSAEVIIETWTEEVENDGETVSEDRVSVEVSYAGISPDIAFFPYSDAEWAHGDLVERKYPQGIISSRLDQVSTDLTANNFESAIEAVSLEAAELIATHFNLGA